ncbi:putative hydroxymethylpyrimidine/phosphomethylpyrimidine kinase 2 [Hypsizygus marmoreus]|uniref:Hydroxymethylpyrimidine/phosphomethylpyrimidine kinase 2 n=1 Tax=Hypsizygus marmoreus TaxID=39966 RepID=A0A369JHK2_HYPMA|nr:putative hydroxymethylpyrimidine/phosphomethylpyrimidine kinase 2 [Hypsizygus marmoreus]
MSKSPPEISVLTIAGSDSSGGAGIQADLKAIAAHGCYGTSAITALTSQNTIGVQGVHPTPPEFVAKQIHSILDDIETRAIKTGMLFDADTVRAVVDALKEHYAWSTIPPLVCDPVCVSTSGHSLLDLQAIQVLIDDLFPLATLITPNRPEAELLLSHRQLPGKIVNIEDMIGAAQNLLEFGSQAVLLKGGHVIASIQDIHQIIRTRNDVEIIPHNLLAENMEILQVDEVEDVAAECVVDVLCETGNIALLVRPRIDSMSTHGTGCTLSAAIASQLALGAELKEAVTKAVAYTHLGIQTAQVIGHGHGPLNHFHSLMHYSIPRQTRTNRHPFTRLLIQGNAREWKQYVEHDFVKLLGKGTLPQKAFVHFIVQDYHYLKYYARAYGLLAAKSTTFEAIGSATQTIINIIHEIGTHKSFCNSFGITNDVLEGTPEAPATTAYGAYVLDVGLQGDSTKLLMALLACLLGYGEVGLWLKKQSSLPNSWVILENNPYRQWMDDYAGENYQLAVKTGLELIEGRAIADPPSPLRFKEWKQVWDRCTILEIGFWDAAMAAA